MTPDDTVDDLPEQIRVRREKRERMTEAGHDPYAFGYPVTTSVAVLRAEHEHLEPDTATGEVVGIAGRIMLNRVSGKIVFATLKEGLAEVQVMLTLDASGAELLQRWKDDVDLGDNVGVTGEVISSRRGELSVLASDFTITSKCLRPLPEKHKGLVDPEQRVRMRYVDLIVRPEAQEMVRMRSAVVRSLRETLQDRGFMEVETPMLQVMHGGANARPFVTHINAYDMPLYLRIAPELYLKRLLVGGMPRVLEWSRNFRNEGLDRSHNPEFTMLELYEAFASYETMMEILEGMIRACAVTVKQAWFGGRDGQDLALPYGELTIDYARPFARVSYEQLFEKAWGFSMNDSEKVRAAAKKAGHKTEGVADILLVNELFERAEAAIDPRTPTFLIDYPAPLCPLTRSKQGRPDIAERFELFIGGMELGNAYTELNDPDIQEAKFREQLGGIDAEESTFRTFDEDFVYALKVGMPPAGGLGVGIDRLMMLLLNQKSIRDVLLFPLMKPVE